MSRGIHMHKTATADAPKPPDTSGPDLAQLFTDGVTAQALPEPVAVVMPPAAYRLFNHSRVRRADIQAVRVKGVIGEHLDDVELMVGNAWHPFARYHTRKEAENECDRLTTEIFGECAEGPKAMIRLDPLPPTIAPVKPDETPRANLLHSGAEPLQGGPMVMQPEPRERNSNDLIGAYNGANVVPAGSELRAHAQRIKAQLELRAKENAHMDALERESNEARADENDLSVRDV